MDDAQSAAGGTRQAARWIASALAAIPALAVVGNLIKGSGDAGFYPPLLFLGVILAAAGAYLGIYLFSTVLEPLPLEEVSLDSFDMSRLPGQPFRTYEQLAGTLATRRGDLARDQYRADKAKVFSVRAADAAAKAEAYATQLETELGRSLSDEALKKRAAEARSDADLRRAEASSLAGTAVATQQQASIWAYQIQGLETIRTQAFHFKASGEVGKRYVHAKRWAILAVGLVAIGLSFLAIAPRAKSQSAPTASLVTLHLNQAGKDALSCQMDTLSAIRIGGTDASPQVITLPTALCTAKFVNFAVESNVRLGTAEEVKPVSSTSASPKP